MRLSNGETLIHAGRPYDPAKAHEYYLRTRKLKGRDAGQGFDPVKSGSAAPRDKAVSATNSAQKQALAARISDLETKLRKLESKARKANAEAKKAAKEAAKPDSKADKSKKAREAKKYRKKNQQKIATKAKTAAGKSGGGSKSSSSSSKSSSGDDLKTKITKIKGQLAVAKSKLRAL